MTLVEVLNNALAESSSSGTGTSYYGTAWKCGQKAYFDRTIPREPYSPGEKVSAAVCGTIFHALMEWWYTPGGEKLIELNDYEPDINQKEALRLFEAYRAERLEFLDLVEVVGTEIPFEFEAGELFSAPFTARLDLVVRLSWKAIKWLEERYPNTLGLLDPGIYIWDFKTRGASDMLTQQKASLVPQFHAYPLVWNKAHPENPCKGLIADYITRTKIPKFELAVVEFPTTIEAQALSEWIATGAELAQQRNPNLKECTEFGICTYLKRGLCDRVKVSE